MNLGEIDLRSVHHNRPQVQRVHTDELPITPVQPRIDECPSLTSSISEATVIPWVTPPSRYASRENSSGTIAPEPNRQAIGVNEAAYASNEPLGVRFDEERISNEMESKREEKIQSMMMNRSPPTPVDATPYIRFAIDQLTRQEDMRALQRPDTARSSDSYPVERIVPDLGLGYVSPHRGELALTRKHRSTPLADSDDQPLFKYQPTRPLSHHSAESVVPPRTLLSAGPDHFVPIDDPTDTPRFPKLLFVPTILRPVSMISFSMLCLLMIIALMFTAIYSKSRNGLTSFSGGIYGSKYFLFGFLPQILSAVLLVYTQAIMAATKRVVPFCMMAQNNDRSRTNPLFLGLYPRTMLYPDWMGPASIKISNTFFWLSIFTIPLQSCLFSVVQVDGVWKWTAVQGVVWTLVVVYALILIATIITGFYFFRRHTGLKWDPTSLADIIALSPRNGCADFEDLDVSRRPEIKERLAFRQYRLGYWMKVHKKTQEIHHCISDLSPTSRRLNLVSRDQEKKHFSQASDVEKQLDIPESRFRYIPWYLHDTFALLWAVAGFVTLVALIVVSFLPRTAIRKGFAPNVLANPNSDGFSPANFLYSFIPSLLGMLLYMGFQTLDMGLRKLQPWAELGRSYGATADRSLLLDYTADLPIKCFLEAFDAGHYRVAIISIISTLFLLLPILAGGTFFPLTTSADGVRMIPNLPAFYICLALLVLYLFGLFSIIPNRRLMHLPHQVDCLSEIISYFNGSHVLEDHTFRQLRCKSDLSTRLMSAQANGSDARYAFGATTTRNGKPCLGIEKLGRPGVRVRIYEPNF